MFCDPKGGWRKKSWEWKFSSSRREWVVEGLGHTCQWTSWPVRSWTVWSPALDKALCNRGCFSPKSGDLPDLASHTTGNRLLCREPSIQGEYSQLGESNFKQRGTQPERGILRGRGREDAVNSLSGGGWCSWSPSGEKLGLSPNPQVGVGWWREHISGRGNNI